MDRLLHLAALALIKTLQSLPLTFAARTGRLLGSFAYLLDRRHRRVALKNLTLTFHNEKSPAEITAIARENFRRIGENYCCAIKTASMTPAELAPHCSFVGKEKLLQHCTPSHTPSIVVAIGHFGNFELYARFGQFVPRFNCAATYRGLKYPSLEKLLYSLRTQSGCLFFERRTGASALKAAMSGGSILLGLTTDQHASGKGGLRLPFLGRDCAVNPAPAVLALRYDCPLFTGICYRVGLAKWRIEAGDEIPTRENGTRRPTSDIVRDVNTAFETAIRRDPANWFWVHNRWKP